MVARVGSRRFSGLIRGASIADLQENNSTRTRRIRRSPSSFSKSEQDVPKRSLASSIKHDSLPRSPLEAGPKRNVRFAAKVRVRTTIHKINMTKEERKSYWIQDLEFNRMRYRNQLLIYRANKFHAYGEPLPDDHLASYEDCEDDIEYKEDGNYLCFRGLEAGLEAEKIRKKATRHEAIQRVLIEQEFQKMLGSPNVEAIAKAYIDATSSCRHRAIRVGMEDRIASEE